MAEAARRWWVWRDGPGKFIAYDNEYPCMSLGGDPLTLGEPVIFNVTGADIREAIDPPYEISWRHAEGRA